MNYSFVSCNYYSELNLFQWLVKRSMEFRQEMSSFVRSYAINQFNKEFPLEKPNKTAHKKILENVATVNEVYRPHRYYRRKNAPPPDLPSRVQITLLEYGLQGESRKKAIAADANGLNVSDGGLDEVKFLFCRSECLFWLFILILFAFVCIFLATYRATFEIHDSNK